jgi:hypothetical protein
VEGLARLYRAAAGPLPHPDDPVTAQSVEQHDEEAYSGVSLCVDDCRDRDVRTLSKAAMMQQIGCDGTDKACELITSFARNPPRWID